MKRLISIGISMLVASMMILTTATASDSASQAVGYAEEYDPATGQVTLIPYYYTPTEINTDIPVESFAAPPASQTYGVVGTDDSRTVVSNSSASPYSGIVRIDLEYTDGERATGTGFLLSPTVVVTAAHNIRRMDNTWCSANTKVTSLATGRSYSYLRSATSSGWGTYHYQANDYGYIILSEPINNVYYFDLGTHSTSDDNSKNYTIAGFCEDKGYSRMYKDNGTVDTYISSQIQSRYIFHYEIDTYRAESGAPIFDSNGTAVGLHAYESGGENGYNCNYNKGVYFDSNVIAFYDRLL